MKLGKESRGNTLIKSKRSLTIHCFSSVEPLLANEVLISGYVVDIQRNQINAISFLGCMIGFGQVPLIVYFEFFFEFPLHFMLAISCFKKFES